MMSFKQDSDAPRVASKWRARGAALAVPVGLLALIGSPTAAFAQQEPDEVVLNEDGGDESNDGLRIHVGSLGGLQVFVDGQGQFYDEGDTPADGGVGNGFYVALGDVEETLTVWGQGFYRWTPVSQSELAGDGTLEDPYEVMTVFTGGGMTVAQTIRYIVPRAYFDIRTTLLPPQGNTMEIRAYEWIDTFLAGFDEGAGFAEPDEGTPTVVGVQRDGQYELLVQGSLAWDHFVSAYYNFPYDAISVGGDLSDEIDDDPTTDNGLAVQWNLGSPMGAISWTYRIAAAQVDESVCGNGVIEGYESCDDEGTADGNGCSAICQIEPGFACILEPSVCAECFTASDCDDGDACTIDACGYGTCYHDPADAGDECLIGVCDGSGTCVECLTSDDCGSTEPFCDTEENTCHCEGDEMCDDDNECTTDACGEDDTCEYTAVSPETECSIGFCSGDQNMPFCACVSDEACGEQGDCEGSYCNFDGLCYDYDIDPGDECASEEGGFCNAAEVGICVECYLDDNCFESESGEYCDTESETCVECLEDEHCDDGNECTRDRCNDFVCGYDLRVGHRCEAGGYCSDEEPVCVECVTFSNCPDEQPQCFEHECVECMTNADCTDDAKPHCKDTTHQCEGCAINADCDDGNDCTTDTCGAQACAHTAVTPGTACEGGYCAGTDSPACVTCADTEDGAMDDGCSEALPVCLTVGNGSSCVVCEVDDDATGDLGCEGETPFCNEDASPRACIECRTTDDCADGEACSTAGACEARCETDDDCLDTSAPHCVVETGECVECLSDEDCEGDDVCSSAGRCSGVDTDDDGVPDSDDLDDDDDGIADAVEAAEDDDTDADGLPNSVDRDSDGDGIADVVESGGADSDEDGVWDDIVDANDNGLADAREGDIDMPDSDADGTPDFLDTDSDDDGIDDAVEASDADYDGAADQPASGNDDDNDGLDGAFDSSEGGSAASLPDQDGDELPDYQDAEGAVVIPVEAGTPEPTDEVEAGAPEPTEEPTTEEPTASEPEPTEEAGTPTTEEPTESEPGTSEPDESEPEPTTEEPTTTPDAGTPPETTTEEIVDAGADAGTDADAGDDGCGCRVVGAKSTQSTPSALWLLALTGLLLKRRSRTSNKSM